MFHRCELLYMSGQCTVCCGKELVRLGRAMLRPVFDQKTKRNGKADSELLRALSWWLEVLDIGLAEIHSWKQTVASTVHLFCDASGNSPQFGAVLFIDGACYWTHMAVDSEMLGWFKKREDQQIMGLELLAISLAISTFADLLSNRNVVVHCDNTGSEVGCPQKGLAYACRQRLCWQASFRRGSAVSWDHAQLVHEQWLHVALIGVKPFIKRVGTHDNIADLPSRGDYILLREMGAIEVPPFFVKAYREEDTWAVLQERWGLHT